MTTFNMITRDEVKKLKAKRKKKMKTIAAVCTLLVILIAVLVFVLINYISDNDDSDGDVTTTQQREDSVDGTDTEDTSTEGTTTEGATTESSTEDVQTNNYPETVTDKYYATYNDRADAKFEYTIPDTELPDVHTIEGNNWANEELFGKNPSDPIALQYFEDAIFVGDSRTEGLILYSDLLHIQGFAYKGLNIGKLETEECITLPDSNVKMTCYDAISNSYYDYYYCMFGINELGWPQTEVFIDYFEHLIDHIYSVNPNAIIYVESILPVTKAKSDGSDIFTMEKVNEFNELLLNMCKERGDVIYLDISAAVTDSEGYLPEEGANDGIHLYTNYCKRVIEYIRCNTYYRK